MWKDASTFKAWADKVYALAMQTPEWPISHGVVKLFHEPTDTEETARIARLLDRPVPTDLR